MATMPTYEHLYLSAFLKVLCEVERYEGRQCPSKTVTSNQDAARILMLIQLKVSFQGPPEIIVQLPVASVDLFIDWHTPASQPQPTNNKHEQSTALVSV